MAPKSISKFHASLRAVLGGLALLLSVGADAQVAIPSVQPQEDIPGYIQRVKGRFDQTLFQQIVGAASDFKDGDRAIGVAAENEISRKNARHLLANTKLESLVGTRSLYADSQERMIRASVNSTISAAIRGWTVGQLKSYLLSSSEAKIKAIMPGLHSDVIAAVVKLMSNDELVQIGQKVFNPLPNSSIGKKGYLSARVQPNSPTDHPTDIKWQVLNAFAFGVGDLMLGTNPSSSTADIVQRTEETLKGLLESFGLTDVMPWTVLAHIDVQNEIEKKSPGSTRLWFQSIAGTEAANQVFGITTEKMKAYARSRRGQKYGLYLETGQGADFTNGKSFGVDMGTLESRKYGLARILKEEQGGKNSWMVVNDVAGFIGPEVFRTKEQLVRVALEDTIMGKLHGLTVGLDVCSTFHMPVTPQDLKWALDRIVPANPAYLMALPTQNDPMLSYNTTSFQEHLRVRQKFGFKIDERMSAFFQKIGVLDRNGEPTEHFGDPAWVYYQLRLRQGDRRSYAQIRADAEREMREVQERGVSLAIGYGKDISEFRPDLARRLNDLDTRSRESILRSWDSGFIQRTLPGAVELHTTSPDRDTYLSRPSTGETLNPESLAKLGDISVGESDVIFVISDGLNADAMMDAGHLQPYLDELRSQFRRQGLRIYERPLVVHDARVRVGYRIAETLFGKADASSRRPKTLIHVIGERPGNGHNTFSAYISTATVAEWQQANAFDHDRTVLVSGIADTALEPRQAARDSMVKIDVQRAQTIPTRRLEPQSCPVLFSR